MEDVYRPEMSGLLSAERGCRSPHGVPQNDQRTKLPEKQICKLEAWMASHSADSELAQLVAEYFRGRGRRKFIKLYVPRKPRDPCQDSGQVDWVKELNGGQDIKVF